jgi:hypothetical protein
MCKATVCFILIILLAYQTLGIASGYTGTETEKQQKLAAEVKSRVEGLGVGAIVAVQGENSVRHKGQISEISESGFTLMAQGNAKSISYNWASGVGLVKPNYKAEGATDPVLVRQSVVNLGVGKNAVIRARGERLKGTIQSIGKEDFTIRSSGAALPSVVRFNEVTEVKAKHFPAWATAVIVGGVGVGVLMGVMLATCGTGGC